jgi:hypothetical protein
MASILNDVFARRLAPILRWGAPLLQLLALEVGRPAPVWIRHLNPGSVWSVVTPEGVEAIRVDEEAHKPLALESQLAEHERLAPSKDEAREAQSRQEIGQEKQRISERLARLGSERTRLGEQLNELETAERVLTRFVGKAVATERQKRGRPASTTRATGRPRRARGRQQAPMVSTRAPISEAILKAVQALGGGATATEVRGYLFRVFGVTVRPNHLAIALQRHRRAGRLETRDQRWYLPPSAQSEQSGQSAVTG